MKTNEMGKDKANSGSPDETTPSGTHTQGKGTGMSSEAGSDQKEESWQGTGGSSTSEAQRKSMNEGNNSQSLNRDNKLENTDTTNNKNQ